MIWNQYGRLTMDATVRYNGLHYPGKSALEQDGVVVTWAEFDRRVSLFANALVDRGHQAGGRVVGKLSNSIDHMVALFGVHRANGVWVSCSTLFPEDEVLYEVQHSGARIAIVEPVDVPMMENISSRLDSPLRAVVTATPEEDSPAETDMERITASGNADWNGPPPESGALATLVYTSGTTSRPKAVMWTHGQFLASARRTQIANECRHEDRVLNYMPMYHSNGGSLMIGPPVLTGATLLIERRFSASRFGEVLFTRDATYTHVNSTHIKLTMSHPETEYDSTHRVRRALTAMYVEPALRDAFIKRFGIHMAGVYGLTEGLGISSATPFASHHIHDSGGLPLPGLEMRVVRADDSDCPVGEAGEILLRSNEPEGLCSGYYADPDATADLFRDGWMYTGDVGVVDANGFIRFQERSKDMIKRSGHNVAPAEVERVLLEHPGTDEAAVVGIPDPLREEAIIGFVTLEPGASVSGDELVSFCRDKLAKFKWPEDVHIVDAFPQNFLGKLEKKRLRELAMAKAGVSTQ